MISPFYEPSNPYTAISFMILQSQENLDTVMPYYKELRKSYTASAAKKMALDYYKLKDSDFTDTDLLQFT